MNVCPRSHLPLCHFGQLAVSPSQLEAACPLFLNDVSWRQSKKELKKKDFCLFHLQEESARDYR